MTIRISSESVPATLKINQFEQLDLDGAAIGDPLATMSWQHPGLFSNNHNSGNPVARRNGSTDEIDGWDFELDIALSNDVAFIYIWGTWMGVYSANWIFAVRR